MFQLNYLLLKEIVEGREEERKQASKGIWELLGIFKQLFSCNIRDTS